MVSRPRCALAVMLALAAFIFSVVFSACGSSEASSTPGPNVDDAQIVSDDGSASLTIPTGALPEGVSNSDIRITRSEGQNQPAEGKAGLFASYDLQPDGLTFLHPVELSINLPADQPGVYAAVLRSGDGGIESPQHELLVDAETEEVTLSTTITHFSTLDVITGLFAIRISNPLEAPVRQPFDVTLQVEGVLFTDGILGETTDRSFTTSTYIGSDTEVNIDGTWELTGLFFTGKEQILAPTAVADAPPRTPVSTTTFTVK